MRLALPCALLCGALPIANGQELFEFQPNSGQFPQAVRFVRHSTDGNFFYLTRDAFVLRNGVRIQIAGIDPKAEPVGENPTAPIYNFYQGNSPFRWLAGARMFGSVRLDNAYPGVRATFGTTAVNFPGVSLGQGRLVFSLAPHADPGLIRIRVLNTGSTPSEGPGGIWFVGGSIPGVFTVSVRATQPGEGGTRASLTAQLIIDSTDTLSVRVPERNATLATEVEVTFPNYDLTRPQSGAPRVVEGALGYPSSLGEDGAMPSSCESSSCTDVVLAHLDSAGKPTWVTVFGGTGRDYPAVVVAGKSGVTLSGTTMSRDLPLNGSSPRTAPGGPIDGFLAMFDAGTGRLRTSTYLGQTAFGWVAQHVEAPDGDIAVSGGSNVSDTEHRGYIVRWRPTENRFVYSFPTESPVTSLATDPDSKLYFASGSAPIVAGVLDGAGKALGSPVRIDLPPGATANAPQLLPLGDAALEFWAIYRLNTGVSYGFPYAARLSASTGRVIVSRRVASQGFVSQSGFTATGNLKLQLRATAPTEPTSRDARIAAECEATSYVAILSRAGQVISASYVPDQELFDFSTLNESSLDARRAAIACFAATAGRSPSRSAAPGELITVTGGGFGPPEPVYTTPDSAGRFPTVASGLQVKIGGIDAPILAVARGLIAVQVPFELEAGTDPVPLEVVNSATALNSIPLLAARYSLSLFDTGDRDNTLGLPTLAALNENGTVNSPQNPAPAGSVISLFGSGLGVLFPRLKSGGLNPTPPDGPLSRTELWSTCTGCEILYLGSAPGLSTSVVQINIRLPQDIQGEGVRPHGIAILVNSRTLSPKEVGILSPTGLVSVR